MRKWNGSAVIVPCELLIQPCTFGWNDFGREVTRAAAPWGGARRRDSRVRPIRDSKCATTGIAGSARNHVCVMLHLRYLYVSKAAILTIPMPPKHRSKIKVPLEFQGLGSLGAASVATVFSLASSTAIKS
jgi:hypothetical protein